MTETVLKDIVLLNDLRIQSVPIYDNQEPLVDLQQEFPELFFDLDRKHVQKESRFISLARPSVGQMLVNAQKHLPTYLKLLIKECHRPLWVQESFYYSHSEKLRRENPSWSDMTVLREASKYCAPPEVSPHTTGGAVDVTLMTASGHELDMGTLFNASPEETRYATYTSASNISRDARYNRNILIEAMSNAGFVNYPTEWWHWSYGDQYWALQKGQPYAIYSSDLTQESFRWVDNSQRYRVAP